MSRQQSSANCIQKYHHLEKTDGGINVKFQESWNHKDKIICICAKQSAGLQHTWAAAVEPDNSPSSHLDHILEQGLEKEGHGG